ncbi:MAG TPA: hypothetical protein VF950_23500 [Planctomycetota bacterium]
MRTTLLTFALLASAGPHDQHPWGRFKPGSSIRWKLGEDRELLQTLKEIGPKGAVLQQDFFAGGKKGLSNTDTDALGLACFHCDPAAKEAGKETLKIDGKDYACAVYAVEGAPPQQRAKKVWIAAGVDVPLKISDVLTSPLQKSLELVAVKVGEELTVGGKKVKTVRLEGKMSAGGADEAHVRWLSADVPGGLVKQVVTLPSGQTMAKEVVAFDAKR